MCEPEPYISTYKEATDFTTEETARIEIVVDLAMRLIE